MQRQRKIGKVFAWFFAGLFALFLLVWLLIQVPAIQTWLVGKVTDNLSKNLQTELRVERVNIRFFKTLLLENIYIEDRQKDTLLFAEELSANIGLFDLFQSEIYINDIGLKNANVQLRQLANDTVFNYQFLIDNFSSTNTDSSSENSQSNWTFGLGNLSILNTKFSMKNEVDETDLNVKINQFFADVDELDLVRQVIDLNQIKLSKSTVSWEFVNQLDTSQIDETTPLIFPEIPWQIVVSKLKSNDNQFIFKELNQHSNLNSTDPTINFNDLNLTNLDIKINDFEWIGKRIEGKIQKLAFQEKSGFELEDFQLDLVADSTQISVENGFLKTPNSEINLETYLTFSSFNDLNDFVNKVKLDGQIKESKIAVFDLKMFAPMLSDIQNLNVDIKEKILISGQYSGTTNNLNLQNFDLKIGDYLTLQTDLETQNLTDVENLVFDLNLKKLSTSYLGFQKITRQIPLPEGLKNFGQFILNGQAKGNISNFDVQSLNLNTQANTKFKITGNIKNALKADRLLLNLKIANLETKADDLRGFSEGNLPPQLDSLGKIRYVGNFNGSLKKFDLIGDLSTRIGILESNLFLDFNSDYSSAKYNGQLELKDFNLGKFLANENDFGKVNLVAKANGQGFELDSLNSDIQAVVKEFSYKKHTYENILIDGEFDRRRFFGQFKIDEASAKLDFDGEVSFNDELPDFKFKLMVDTLMLKPLNLTHSTFNFSGGIACKIRGNNPDNFTGNLSVQKFHLSNDSIDFYSDTLLVGAVDYDPKDKEIALNSKFMTAKLRGNYKVAEMPRLITQFMRDYAVWMEPIVLDSTEVDSLQYPIADQNFSFDLEILDHRPFSVLFLPALADLGKARFTARFDSQRNLLDVDGRIDEIDYANQKIEKIDFIADSEARKIKSKITAQNWDGGGYFLDKTVLSAGLLDDSLNLNLRIENDTAGQRLALAGALTKWNEKYDFSFRPQFFLNNDRWTIPEKNSIRFSPNYLYVKSLQFKRKNQSITIESIDEQPPKELLPLKVAFDNFKISEISELLDRQDDFFEGEINGSVMLKDFYENLHYNSDLTITNLTLKKQTVGDLIIQANQSPQAQQIDVLVDLQGEKNNLRAQGNYAIKTQTFDINSNIEQLELRILDPFLTEFISESSGNLTGNFTLTGTPEKPNLNGEIGFQNASTKVVFTQIRYEITEGKIPFNKKEIVFNDLILRGQKEQKAVVSGKIFHDFFSQMRMDLALKTDEFQFLNTTVLDNQLFYGKLFLNANIRITGPPENPYVNVIAKTLSPSVFYLSPFAESQAIIQDDYIIFGNPETYYTDNPEGRDYQIQSPFPFDVDLNLELSDAAELQFIIDPLSGDKLVCRGNSNLFFKMTSAGTMEMYGTYTVESGYYNFSYGNLVKRKFNIKEGGQVYFNGDPLNARFNVTAVYETRATTYELIKNEATLSNSEVREAQRRTPVEVLLQLSGQLSSPSLEFDINLPENQGSAVSSTVNRKLEALRSNPNDLNQQVFGLILVNSFVLAESSNVLAGAGENTALSSVSKLFTNQLNRLADRYIKGVEVNVDIDSYKSQYGNGESASRVTELGIGISKQLFNDRLTVSVGGNLDVEGTNSNASSFAGDFLLEYKLTEDGDYLLRVFRKSDYDVLLEENSVRNGVSLFFRKEFDGKKRKQKN